MLCSLKIVVGRRQLGKESRNMENRVGIFRACIEPLRKGEIPPPLSSIYISLDGSEAKASWLDYSICRARKAVILHQARYVCQRSDRPDAKPWQSHDCLPLSKLDPWHRKDLSLCYCNYSPRGVIWKQRDPFPIQLKQQFHPDALADTAELIQPLPKPSTF